MKTQAQVNVVGVTLLSTCYLTQAAEEVGAGEFFGHEEY